MLFKRRHFIAALAAAPLIFGALPAWAENVIAYTPSVLQAQIDGGEPYLLDFFAEWCTTCQAQKRVLSQLQAENPAFDAIPIIRVDWDLYRDGPLVEALAIPRRSVLVMMQGDQELGRVVAQTSKQVISDLLGLGT